VISVARVYDAPPPGVTRVLVDRLWPRGVRKDGAPLDEWCKDIAPSTELRTWYGHEPDRFAEFRRRYRAELRDPARAAALQHLRGLAASGDLVLVTATKDVDRSAATVLAAVLSG
jgi:uncharacterized protein YeaO (DUF488 family)